MMSIARLPQRRLRKTLALGAVNEVLMLLLWLTCWISGAAEFPMPETYGEDGLPRYMEAAAAFLNNSPESIYAPRVAFDALVLAKNDPKRIELRGDLEVSLIIDYSGSLHGGYYQRTLSDSKSARAVLQRILRHYAKKPRQDFPQKYAEALNRLITQCGLDLIEDRGFALESMLVLEQTDSTELRHVLQENFRVRLKPDDSVVGFVNEATDAGIPVVDRVLVLHKHALEQDVIAASLRDLLLLRLNLEELSTTKIRFVRAETFLGHRHPRKALEEYAAVKPDEFGEKEWWLKGWSAAQTGDVLTAQKCLDELRARFPDGEYLKLAATVFEWLSRGEAVNEYTNVFGQMIESAAQHTDSFHVMVRCKPSKDRGECVIFLNFSSPRQEFSVLMCDGHRKVLAAFRSGPNEMRAYLEGWKWIRRIEEPGFIPVPVLSLKLDEDGNSFEFRSRSVGFGVPIPCPLLDVPWFAGPERQAEMLRYFEKSGMCFGPITENSSGRTLRCIWPTPAGASADEWRLNVSSEGRLLKIEGKEQIWEVRSGTSINEPFLAPEWPKLPVRVESDSGSTFLEVFMKILRAIM